MARDPAVDAAFEGYAPRQRAALADLRRLIFEAAREAGVEIVETLKWGQPSYLPARPRVGTTIRIDALKGSNEGFAMYVHCQTSLMQSFRHLYPDTFATEGERALLFSTQAPLPEAAVKHCARLALTYHRAKG